MKVTIALDPNVILAACLEDSHYEGLLTDIQDSQDYIRIAVDEDGTIFNEFAALRTNQAIHREIRDWLTQIMRQQSRFIQSVSAPLAKSKYDWLCDIGCGTPVESQLIGICAEKGRDIRLIVAGKDINHEHFHSRGLHSDQIIKAIKKDYPHLIILDAFRARRSLSNWLKDSPLPPHNQLELESYLRERDYRERQYLEFKQPEDSRNPTHLTRSILIESMQELCGMANATGKGKVVVGIFEDKRTKLGEIRGFPPIYENSKEQRKPKSENELEIILRNDYLNKFNPQFALEQLQFEFFEVYGEWHNRRLVLVFHLELKSAADCRYDGKKWIRKGTENSRVR